MCPFLSLELKFPNEKSKELMLGMGNPQTQHHTPILVTQPKNAPWCLRKNNIQSYEVLGWSPGFDILGSVTLGKSFTFSKTQFSLL